MTHIWVPKVGILEGEAAFSAGRLEGEYTLRRYKADTGAFVQQVGPFKNLITNAGLDRAGEGTSRTLCFVGTSSTPPAVTNTTMGAYLAQTSGSSVSWNASVLRGGPPDYWVQGAGTWRFAQGVATGNLTEVGVGWADSASGTPEQKHRVFSRALIVDSEGDPVTITVLADEFLDVTYALRFYPPVGPDVVQTIDISGVPYTFTSRLRAVENQTRTCVPNGGQQYFNSQPLVTTGTAPGTPPALAPVTADRLITPGANGTLTVTPQAYILGSLKLSSVYSADLTSANLAYGLRGFELDVFNGSGWQTGLTNYSIQATISPAIPKNNTNVLSFGASMTWARK